MQKMHWNADISDRQQQLAKIPILVFHRCLVSNLPVHFEKGYECEHTNYIANKNRKQTACLTLQIRISNRESDSRQYFKAARGARRIESTKSDALVGWGRCFSTLFFSSNRKR